MPVSLSYEGRCPNSKYNWIKLIQPSAGPREILAPTCSIIRRRQGPDSPDTFSGNRRILHIFAEEFVDFHPRLFGGLVSINSGIVWVHETLLRARDQANLVRNPGTCKRPPP